MHIVALKDSSQPDETRVPLIPDDAARLVSAGARISVESGLGNPIQVDDTAFIEAGAAAVTDRVQLLGEADMILRIGKPTREEIAGMRPGCIYVSLLDPFNERSLIDAFADKGVSAISMEMIPRTTRAQKMDVLSSQASLAGYIAVIVGSERLGKIMPMMMTPAGTIKPSRVFVVGAGVAGLQAIATAKRLGARVDAFDTRPVVEEQVKSLGGRFVKIDLGDTGETAGGYAKALTDEQIQKQREGMARVCASSDLVITTAQLFGRKAPLIITREMIDGMQPGSVIIDLAVESGGNVEGSEVDREIDINGVRIVGLRNLPGRVPVHASQMFSSNLFNLIDEFWDAEAKAFDLRMDDELIQGCLITHEGRICNPVIARHYGIDTDA